MKDSGWRRPRRSSSESLRQGIFKTPVELVINSIGRNHIHGYVSEPKYKGAELEAMANSSANNPRTDTNGLQAASPAKPSPVRQRLEPPHELGLTFAITHRGVS
jgi:hypothetical protein